jgi:hypothetical protein
VIFVFKLDIYKYNGQCFITLPGFVTGVSVSGSNVKIKMHEGEHMDNQSRDGTHTTRSWKILGRLHAYLMDDSTGLCSFVPCQKATIH